MNPKTLAKQIKVRPVLESVEIEKLLAMRETQKALKERLALMDQAISQAEDTIISAVDSGADLSRIPYAVSVQDVVRRYPAWKEHFISRLGKAEADAVLESTAPVIHRKVVIK